ncbi:hypothetical protein ILUMI_08052 [Ignelater luminosus]|uniref:DDE-1 domain-containing protein n=1 Tax=Ignelater luminosus TaxID=2038154 RepID=A0A8K0D7M3_IGNLU|nr:hypothetical protein ILUMI_08052 [Ignelater luminosus]
MEYTGMVPVTPKIYANWDNWDIRKGQLGLLGPSYLLEFLYYSTCKDYAQDKRGVKGKITDDSRRGGGVKAYLPSEIEEEIANCLKILDKKDVFLKNIGLQRPVLLIYDGHVTHISVELIKLAQENQVTMKLPPHTTHVLPPLGVAVFKGLKTKWDQVVSKLQRNGFAATGIYDLKIQDPNRAAILFSVFKTTDLKRYNEQLQCSKPLPITEGELNETKQGKQSGKDPERASNEKKSNKEDLEKKSAEKKPEKEEQQEKSNKKLDKKDVPETADDIFITSTSKNKTVPVRSQTFEELVLGILKTNEDPRKEKTLK